jgi:hypothetical protein
LNRFCEAASYWLQIGFNKGKKKYPNNGKACCIFMDIEKKVDGFLKYAEEGDEIHIRFKKTELSAQVNHISYYELLPEDYAY